MSAFYRSFVAILLLSPATLLAGPREELLRLVPDDMSICAVMTGLRDALPASKPLNSLFKLPAVSNAVGSAEFKKLLAIRDKVLKELNVEPGQLRDDLLGDAIVLGFRQGPANEADSEQVILMVRARDKVLLGRVMARVNELQKKSGELKEIRDLDHRGIRFHERVKADDKPAEFYAISDHVLIFSPQQAVLKNALERLVTPVDAESIWAKKLRDLGMEQSLFAVMVNPRQFDAELQAQEKIAVTAADRAFLKEFREYWKALESAGLHMQVTDSLELGLAIRVNRDSLPVASRAFLSALAKPSSLWSVIPEDALFAFALRSDLGQFAKMARRFMPDDQANQISAAIEGSMRPFLPGTSRADSVLKGLGPDWGFWVESSAHEGKGWVPGMSVALRLSSTPDGEAAETTLRTGVQYLLTAAQFANRDGLKVTTSMDGKIEIKTLEFDSVFPKGFRPSFAAKDGYLLLTGSPETIRRFKPPAEPMAKADTPVLRMSGRGWHRYLSSHKQEAGDFIGKLLGEKPVAVIEQINLLLPNLAGIDRFEIGIRTRDNLATITMRLELADEK